MYHGRFFPMSQMKKEALETSPVFPGEKGSVGDIPQRSPERKEALEASPSVPQRERKRWRHLPAFPREKGGVGDIPQRSPERKEAWENSPEFNGG
jgi:hypothetical protein